MTLQTEFNPDVNIGALAMGPAAMHANIQGLNFPKAAYNIAQSLPPAFNASVQNQADLISANNTAPADPSAKAAMTAAPAPVAQAAPPVHAAAIAHPPQIGHHHKLKGPGLG